MKIINFSPIGFYAEKEEQPFRAPYAQSFEGIHYVRPAFTNIMMTIENSILSTDYTPEIAFVQLYDMSDNLIATYDSDDEFCVGFNFNGANRTYYQIIYNFELNGRTLPNGTYYFRFFFSNSTASATRQTTDAETWQTIESNTASRTIQTTYGVNVYSDLFQVVDTYLEPFNGFIVLQGSSPERVNVPGDYLDFDNQHAPFFEYIFKTNITKPEYAFEESIVNRLGYQFIETATSKKIYKFTTLGFESLCDSLRLFKLLPVKRIYSGISFTDGGTSMGYYKRYDPMVFNMVVEWQQQGDVASIACDFEIDTIINNLNVHNI